MTVVSEIYSSNNRGSFQASAKMKNALENVSASMDPAGEKRFQTQSQIVEANLSTAYGDVREREIWRQSCGFNITTATMHNADQTQLINDVDEVYRTLYKNIDAPGTDKTVMCNKALGDIQKIMNGHHKNGRYILGGRNNDVLPCGDLVAVDNIVNGKATTNYTKVMTDSKNLPLSRLNNFTLDMDARNPVFANVIAAINSIKNDSPNKMAMNDAADQSLKLAAARNLSDKLEIDQAGEVNLEDEKTDDAKLKELAYADPISSMGDFKDATIALKMSMITDAEMMKLSRAFVDSMGGF